ncbi:hypothetical protein BASA62_003775 [Batrachochytrium salamandrivorans]|nr:hypothetical protein BASA62_003775 [Batrachochytrium salamandrivorans]
MAYVQLRVATAGLALLSLMRYIYRWRSCSGSSWLRSTLRTELVALSQHAADAECLANNTTMDEHSFGVSIVLDSGQRSRAYQRRWRF